MHGLRSPSPASSGTGALRALARPALTTAVGVVASMAILVAANAPPLHPGATAAFRGEVPLPDPRTCSMGTCWDGLNKHGFPTSTRGFGQTVRGVVITPDDFTTYRSIAYNLEPNTALAFSVMAGFILLVSQIANNLFRLLLVNQLRFSAFFALLGCIFPVFYSYHMLFVYINEFMPDVLPSQLFFTLTETVLVHMINYFADSETLPTRLQLVETAGVALLHILQLALDETWGDSLPNHGRNLFLVLGDIGAFVLCGNLLYRHQAPSFKNTSSFAMLARDIFFVVAFGMAVFQLAFAGRWSFALW